MNLLEKNLNLLEKKNPQLAKKIANIMEIKANFSLEESLSGDANLKKNGFFLHDNVDPEQEAIDLLRKINDNNSCSFNFIYGLGLGYVFKRFCKSLHSYIILYEPDLEVLRITFELVDFEQELSNENVFVFDTLDGLSSIYPTYFFDDFAITTTIQECYKQFDIDSANTFIKHLGYTHGLYLSNYEIFWNKSHPWINSLIDNLEYLHKYDEVKSLENRFQNKPGLIISAGPSLDKNIDLIAKYQDNFVIFAVGAALKSLEKHNIKADFVCFIEYMQDTYKYIEGINLKNSNLIVQPITAKTIINANSKNKFLFYADNDKASKWLADIYNIDRTDYINRGTVSVNALVSAKIMGCNPLILVGQDLAYTDNKCYSKDTLYGDYNLVDNKITVDNLEEFAKKINSSEIGAKSRMDSLTKTLYPVKGQNGEDLLTPGDFATFISYFTGIANIYETERKLINATQGGAQIDGYENMLLQDVISTYAKDPINKSFTPTEYNPEKHKKLINKEITLALKQYKNYYKNIFTKASRIAQKISSFDVNDFNSKLDNELQSLLKLIKELYLHLDSKLFLLLISKNMLFIEKYITKPDDITYKKRLLKHLLLLFKDDYEQFIEPSIEKIRKLYKTGDN